MFLSYRQKTYLKTLMTFLGVFIAFRLIFFLSFFSTAPDYESLAVFKALYLGFKFDLRVAILYSLPIWLITLIPFLKAHFNDKIKKAWVGFYAFLFTATFIWYLGDLGYYAYLEDRINASISQFFYNPLISLQMVWQTYPVIPFVILIILGAIASYKYFFRLFSPKEISQTSLPFKKRALVNIALVLATLGGIYGKWAYYPLRWSEAFFSGNRFVASLGLNPVHYFFDTLANKSKSYDTELVKKYYPIVSEYLGVKKKDIDNLNFQRMTKATPIADFKTKPNIVIIIMESMSAHRTGAFGNPTQATPHFDEMAENGLLFTHFYTPSEGTARGVFATIASVTDINAERTSSRNPLIIDQNTAVNALKNYERYFFIGGNANWGNIRGVLTNNIYNLKLWEEDMYESPRTDVWGISDYHLFQEAHRVLDRKKTKQPFFAVIQSAGFHRPYTIPEDRGDFELSTLPKENYKKWGWESIEELNSMKFADHALGTFMKLAKDSKYFENTIFVVLGDHGLPDNKSANLNSLQIKFATERFHTPLLFYSPKYLPASKNDTLVSQVDVIPSLAAMTGHDFINTGLGRNVFSQHVKENQFLMSYVYYRNPHYLIAMDRNYLIAGHPEKIESMHLFSQEPKDLKDEKPEHFQKMSDLANGLYQTSKYLLYNNKKQY